MGLKVNGFESLWVWKLCGFAAASKLPSLRDGVVKLQGLILQHYFGHDIKLQFVFDYL